MMIPAALLNALKTRLPSLSVEESPGELEVLGQDASKKLQVSALGALFPKSTQEVATIVQTANDLGVKLLPSGGRTGYSGGAVAVNGEVILSLSKMNRVLEIDSVGYTLHVEAGVTTQAAKESAEKAGMFFPVDFASKGSSQIGGNVATNAGGIRVVRYGPTRDWVLGLEVVTGEGKILTIGGSLIKNQAGPDLKGIFIGSEGILGVITAVTLKLTSPPVDGIRALFAISSPKQALSIFTTIKQAGFVVGLCEYFDATCLEIVTTHAGLPNPWKNPSAASVLVEVEASTSPEKERAIDLCGSLLEKDIAEDCLIAQSPTQASQLLALRERISETIGRHFVPHKDDVSLPVAALGSGIPELEKLLRELHPASRIAIFGHIGDGNLHVNILKPESQTLDVFMRHCASVDIEVAKFLVARGGSPSAEHGIGYLKKHLLPFAKTAGEISTLRQLKQLFDPKGVLSPGKVL